MKFSLMKKAGEEHFFRIVTQMYKKIPVDYRLEYLGKYYKLKGHCGIGDPFRVYSISPFDVTHEIYGSLIDFHAPEFGIKSGDWDKTAKPINPNNMWFQHFRDGERWEDIEKYHKIRKKLERGEIYGQLDAPPKRQTPKLWKKYLVYIDHLYLEIKKEGYKRQIDLTTNDDFFGQNIHPSLNEIQVFIGRDGKIMVKSGRHRLYIAQCLELDSIPVRTQIRHTKWQQTRDEIVATKNYDELSKSVRNNLHHPDLRDIVPLDWVINS